jgi:D-3-phosphoglycerate dehydrogenase / 2-oxoglutarate reductase
MKQILTILEPEHFSPQAMERLREHFSPDEPWCANVEVLWTRLRVPDISRYPFLKVIACNCTDVSHLPLEECKRRGIEVLSLKGIEGLENVHATAEHTISLMLQALRHRCDRSGGRIGRELRGKTVNIVGMGRIGCQVANLHWALGFSPRLTWREADGDTRWGNLLSADIITLHVPLNDETRGMVDEKFLQDLKPGCILVNTARDAIVQREAIYAWLGRDEQAIYAHDFADEWDRPEVVRLADIRQQIIATPHIGGWTIESLHKTEELLAEKVIEWAKARMEVSV